MTDKNINGWTRNEKHVLSELERISDQLGIIDEKFDQFRIEQARHNERLTLKTTTLGFLSGAIPIAIVIALKQLF
jgi:hypothetical protein